MKQADSWFQLSSPTIVKPIFGDAYPIMRRVAGVRAAEFARKYGLSSEDRLDLEQEVVFQVWRKLGVFDSSRASLKTFIEHLVANLMVSYVRRVYASKRLLRTDATARAHIDSGSDRAHLRIDVLRVLRALPPQERVICRMLAAHSVSEVSRQAGIPRATLYRLIRRLRFRFSDAGLQPSRGAEKW